MSNLTERLRVPNTLESALRWGMEAADEIERLEKQLSDRDAALARCVEVLTKIANGQNQHGMTTGPMRMHNVVGIAVDTLASLPTFAQATAKVLVAARELEAAWESYSLGGSSNQHVCRAENALSEAIREEKEGK